jgi:hypothetical protein
MKPLYKQRYLKNGREYEKEYSLWVKMMIGF